MERPGACSTCGLKLPSLQGRSYSVGRAPLPYSTLCNIKQEAPDVDDYVRPQPVHVTRALDASLITIPACQIRPQPFRKSTWVASEWEPLVLPKYKYRSEEDVPAVSSWEPPELKPSLVIPLKVRSKEVPVVVTERPSCTEQPDPPSVITYKRRPRPVGGSVGGHKVPEVAGAKAVVRRRQRFKSLATILRDAVGDQCES